MPVTKSQLFSIANGKEPEEFRITETSYHEGCGPDCKCGDTSCECFMKSIQLCPNHDDHHRLTMLSEKITTSSDYRGEALDKEIAKNNVATVSVSHSFDFRVESFCEFFGSCTMTFIRVEDEYYLRLADARGVEYLVPNSVTQAYESKNDD